MPTYSRRTLLLLCPLIPPLLAASAAERSERYGDALTYEAAVARALEWDPQRHAHALAEDAADGHVEQARLRPRPSLEAEIEHFPDPTATELTLGWRQTVETSRKRERRTALAERESDLLRFDREERVAGLRANAHRRFYAALAARDRLALRIEQQALEEEILAESRRRVAAALAPAEDATRAQLAARRRALATRQAEQALSLALHELASLLDRKPIAETELSGRVESSVHSPVPEPAPERLSRSPRLARFKAMEDAREAALNLEMAQSRADVDLFAGVRLVDEEESGAGVVAGIEIPWPAAGHNRGAVRAARAALEQVAHERETVRRALATALAQAQAAREAALADIHAMERELIPLAEQAVEEARASHDHGRTPLLTVLEAQAALLALREERLDAFTRLIEADAELIHLAP